jgi:formylglycine-generating enzyme required for sulfatase activity/serine/threonine protein kinase
MSQSMKYRLWRSGETIDLSREKKLGEGGEAGVFCVAAMGMAAKIYHRPDPRYADKLKVMLANPPADPASAQGHVSIAWPSDLLLHQGAFRGYVMPLVEGMLPLVNFYVPKLRREKRPLFDYYYLVTAALNVATAMRALHERDYVIGDVNESNILVSDRALATVVDTDSFQVADAATGAIYRCLVGKPEFTPPELQAPGTNFARVDRAREHDSFGLAVMLFQLLMEGTHPFDGVYSGPGEPPSIDERIAHGHFPHADGASGPNRPKPMAPSFGMLEPGLQRLFVQCFVEGHRHPSARPDAAAWRVALEKARPLMRTCPANERHRHWGHVPCPWCERMRRMRGFDPFPSAQAVKQGLHLLQRADGAKTPQPPTPLRARPAPPRRSPLPAQSRATVLARRPPVSRRVPVAKTPGMNFGGIVFLVIVALQAIVGSLSNPRVTPPHLAPPPALPKSDATLAAKKSFLNNPVPGWNFRASAGINMVWIAPGRFQMGDSTERGESGEGPVHEVRLTEGYWIAESELTQGQWLAVMGGSNPSHAKGDQLPVESVSWNEAAVFCQKLTEIQRSAGHLPAGYEIRLPTEAQWEDACRAGSTGDYAGDLNQMAWYASNSGFRTREVKTKQPNAWGLYDMHGNVWEWCFDWDGPYSAGLQVNPQGPAFGDYRIIRGGAWSRKDSGCRSATRGRLDSDARFDNVGFRPAVVSSRLSTAAALQSMAAAASAAPKPLALAPRLAVAKPEERRFAVASGVSVTMCWIPAGTFTMGSPASEPGRSPNEAQTQARLSHGFWLAKTECNQLVWRAVMGTNPSHFQGDDLPVEQVSWSDCQAFIGRLRLPAGGWRFALPTEAQWEYACRAGTTGPYAGDLDAMGWHKDNSGPRPYPFELTIDPKQQARVAKAGGMTHPVGAKLANAWGLQDMHGNVMEWCRDAYAERLPGGADPQVMNGVERVFRGGSWTHDASYSRSAFRRGHVPEERYYFLGFRLAAVPPQ